jgi:hypothetical protein
MATDQTLSAAESPRPSTRCRHDLVPLVPRPASVEGRVNYLFCPLTRYMCERCGRVGWYTKHRGRLQWFSAEESQRKRQEAEAWR